MAKEIKIDTGMILSPLIAGHIANSFYSALLLKKLSGVEITPEIEKKTREEVIRLWLDLKAFLENHLPKRWTSFGPI